MRHLGAVFFTFAHSFRSAHGRILIFAHKENAFLFTVCDGFLYR
jgi:hypothetical protein